MWNTPDLQSSLHEIHVGFIAPGERYFMTGRLTDFSHGLGQNGLFNAVSAQTLHKLLNRGCL
jgi:hypothetical protein